jgi:hypothetical protein
LPQPTWERAILSKAPRGHEVNFSWMVLAPPSCQPGRLYCPDAPEALVLASNVRMRRPCLASPPLAKMTSCFPCKNAAFQPPQTALDRKYGARETTTPSQRATSLMCRAVWGRAENALLGLFAVIEAILPHVASIVSCGASSVKIFLSSPRMGRTLGEAGRLQPWSVSHQHSGRGARGAPNGA